MTEYCDDHIPSQLIDERRVKAKKDHVCQFCGRDIKKGQSYIRKFGLIDGEPTVQKLHSFSYDCEFDVD